VEPWGFSKLQRSEVAVDSLEILRVFTENNRPSQKFDFFKQSDLSTSSGTFISLLHFLDELLIFKDF
jgi:hypothetical protein